MSLYKRTKRMQRVMVWPCTHDVKVTFLKKVGYGIRVFLDGVVNQSGVVRDRLDIGPAIRDMLRMEDKCGNYSKMADRSRHRPGEK